MPLIKYGCGFVDPRDKRYARKFLIDQIDIGVGIEQQIIFIKETINIWVFTNLNSQYSSIYMFRFS